jgi:hypothetical protein
LFRKCRPGSEGEDDGRGDPGDADTDIGKGDEDEDGGAVEGFVCGDRLIHLPTRLGGARVRALLRTLPFPLPIYLIGPETCWSRVREIDN